MLGGGLSQWKTPDRHREVVCGGKIKSEPIVSERRWDQSDDDDVEMNQDIITSCDLPSAFIKDFLERSQVAWCHFD